MLLITNITIIYLNRKKYKKEAGNSNNPNKIYFAINIRRIYGYDYIFLYNILIWLQYF